MVENHYDLTPYNYVMNSPIVYGDEFGMDTTKVINLRQLDIFGKAPQRQSFTGFYGNFEYFMTGGNYGKYHYNMQGRFVGLAPIMGFPPDLNTTGFSWSSIKSVGKALSNWRKLLGLSKTAFNILDQDGKIIIYSTKIGDEVIKFGGEFDKVDDVLTIKNLDIDGNLTNKLGINGLKEMINNFGRDQGVSKVIVEGAKRTTGANPGRLPARLVFDIK
jgi:hypothetical protein